MFDIGKHTYKSDIELGKRYRDPQTGIEGITTSIHFYQYACERVTLEVMVQGKLEEYTFDAPRLETVEAEPKRARATRTGGPGSSVRQASAQPKVPGR